MLVVPVAGDKILTKDNSDEVIVSSYSNLKDEPAVYLKPTPEDQKFAYFKDIVSINGVRVEYDPSSKLFKALGTLRRKFNLPQPKDIIVVRLMDVPYKKETTEVVVDSLKLHNKREGVSRGLLACGEKSCFTLSEILDIKRDSWTETFNAQKFCRFYFDYLPLKSDA
jgi:hypothetical protein